VDSLLTTSMYWITAPRSAEDRESLANLPCLCTPAVKADVLHQQGLDFFSSSTAGHTTPFASLFQHLGNSISAKCHRNIYGSMAPGRDYWQIVNRRRSWWPTCFDQLLPHGPEDTTRGLIAWLSDNVSPFIVPVIIQILSPLILFTYPLTTPYILTSSTLITDGILPILDSACDYMHNNYPLYTSAAYDENTELTLAVVLGFMTNIVRRFSNEVQRRVWLQENATRLLDTYDRALIAHDQPHARGKPAREYINSLACLLLQDFPGLAQRTAIEQGRRLQMLHSRVSERTAWEKMVSVLAGAAKSYRCASPGCMLTTADLDPGAFRLCGGCRRVSYCSRECQKADWKCDISGVLPHREICNMIQSMCQEHGISRRLPVDQWHNNVPVGFEVEVGYKITDYFLSHTQHELSTCGKYFSVSPRTYVLMTEKAAYRSEAKWKAEIEQRRSSERQSL
jgi:hypothetical protein